MVITPEPTKILSSCKIKPIINKVNLIELPKQCDFTIAHETYINKDDSKVKEEIILPNLILHNTNHNLNFKINLEDVNLKDIHNIMKNSNFKQNNESINDKVIKYSWTPIYLIVFSLISYYTWKRRNHIKKLCTKSTTEVTFGEPPQFPAEDFHPNAFPRTSTS